MQEDVADFLLWISFLSALGGGFFFCAQIKFGICGWEGAPRLCTPVVFRYPSGRARGWAHAAPHQHAHMSAQLP